MYFLTKKLDDTYLAGLHNNYIYSIGKTNREIKIYRKDVFDAGKWDYFQSIALKFSLKSDCDGCNANIPCTIGTYGSKLWIVATILADKKEDETIPVLFSINLNTKAVTKFTTKNGFFYSTRHIKYICIKCKSLAFEENDVNSLHLLIQKDSLYNKCCKSYYYSGFTYEPITKVFWISVANELKTCKFGECINPEKTLKYISNTEIFDNKFLFNVQQIRSDGMNREPLPYTHGAYYSYDITSDNFAPQKCYSQWGPKYYRSNKNEIHCLYNEKLADDSFELSNYKINIDFENKNVTKTNFCNTTFGCFSLTLSETAYIALCKIPKVIVTNKKNEFEWMSMEFLYNKLDVPHNVKILHRNNC